LASAAATILQNEIAAFGPAFVLPDIGHVAFTPIANGAVVQLTTGVDTLTGSAKGHTLFYATLSGQDSTLNSGDSVVGQGAGNVLQIDAFDGSAALLPIQISVSGVETLNVNAKGNIGVAPALGPHIGVTSFVLSPFDLSQMTGLTKAVLTSNGSGTDYVIVGAGTDVVSAAFKGAVQIIGGHDVSVSTPGMNTVEVAGAAGAIHISDGVPFGFIYSADHVTVDATGSVRVDVASSDGTTTSASLTTTVTVGDRATVSLGSGGGSDIVHIGENGAVTLTNGADHALIDLSASLAGPAHVINFIPTTGGYTASAYFDVTGITGAIDGTKLQFDSNANHSFVAGAVDVSSASGIRGALTMAANAAGTIAAGSSVLTWFQYGGNTYLVENVNASATAEAHSDIQSTDAIVQLTGLVNVGAHGVFDAKGIFTI
jgi:hypothetical protein